MKTTFKTQLEFDLYKTEQKIRMEKGYLTRSEREEVKKILVSEYKPIIKEDNLVLPKGKAIITNIRELSIPSELVTKEDDIKGIVQDLKDTLANHPGYGLSAKQIGINKRISYIKVPKKYNEKTKEVEYMELVLINPKIEEKLNSVLFKGEGCISFPGIFIDTDRFAMIIIKYLDEEFKEQSGALMDIEAIVAQHEIDHQNGITLFNRKHRSK